MNENQSISNYDDSSSQSSYDNVLQPINHILRPANQILSKIYQPDLKPSVKLVIFKQKQKEIINQLQQKQDSLKAYEYIKHKNFSSDDTLANYLKENIKKYQLVYWKFNNQKHMKCPINKINYLSGIFTPYADMLKPELRKSKNLLSFLKKSSNIQIVQPKASIENSFGPNCLSKQGQLKFSSNYQGSNLLISLKKSPCQYQLILSNDTNSKGTTQWFNFAISICQATTYKFNIINLTKNKSLFEKGMNITYYSFQNKILKGTDWNRGTDNITYAKNSILREGTHQSYYTLTFQYTSPHKFDTVVFSYCFAYSSLEMERFFSKLTLPKASSCLKAQKIKICQTISGLPVYCWHLQPKKPSSHPSISQSFSCLPFESIRSRLQQNKQKALIFLARQHPGQSQSSFILQGIVQFLMENNDYDLFKRGFHVYLFPIVNVDGVQQGNYRTNLSGNDLNRVWKLPRKDFHAEVYYIKRFLHTLSKTTSIKLIIDLHGHSSAYNSFFYGNPVKKQNVYQSDNPKLFPYFCSKNMKQVSFAQSRFKASDDKKASARVVLNQMFPKALVYTLQTSFDGYKKGRKIIPFTIQRYNKLGRSLIKWYFQYIKVSQRTITKQKWLKQIQQLSMPKKPISSDQSDSQMQDDFLQQQQGLNAIQQQDINVNKEILHNQYTKINSTKARLFYNRAAATRNIRKRESVIIQKNQAKGVFFDNSLRNISDTSITHPHGFLSIVKIDTKKSLDQVKYKQTTQIDPIYQKQNYKIQESPIIYTPPRTPKQKERSFRQIFIINEKDELMKNRRIKNELMDSKSLKMYVKSSAISLNKHIMEKMRIN